MDDRANTLAGWVLAAGIVALGTSIVAGEYFHSERPEKMGYVVEGVEAEAGEGGAVAEQPFAFYMSQADAAKGADVFKKCAACHNADKGGANALGPNIYGVVGDPVATGRGGFAFSDGYCRAHHDLPLGCHHGCGWGALWLAASWAGPTSWPAMLPTSSGPWLVWAT